MRGLRVIFVLSSDPRSDESQIYSPPGERPQKCRNARGPGKPYSYEWNHEVDRPRPSIAVSRPLST